MLRPATTTLLAVLLILPQHASSLFAPRAFVEVSKPASATFDTEPTRAADQQQEGCSLSKVAKDNMALDEFERCLSPCFVVIKPDANTEDLCHQWSPDHGRWFEDVCTMICEDVAGFENVRSDGTCTVNSQQLPLYRPGAPAAAVYALPMRCADARCMFVLGWFPVENGFVCKGYAYARDVISMLFIGGGSLVVVYLMYQQAKGSGPFKSKGDPSLDLVMALMVLFAGEVLVLIVSMLWDFVVALVIVAGIIFPVTFLFQFMRYKMTPDAGEEKHAADPAKVALPKPS
jgi:hypothetical protein